jgi:hypothetical protein
MGMRGRLCRRGRRGSGRYLRWRRASERNNLSEGDLKRGDAARPMDSMVLQRRSAENQMDEVEHALSKRGEDGDGAMLREKLSLGLESRDKPFVVDRQAVSLGRGGRRCWRRNCWQ